MRYSNNPRDIGTKLGPKLAEIISKTIVSTKVKLLDTEHKARTHSMQEIIDRAGREVADLYKPVWDEALGEQDMPDWVRTHMEKIVSGRHQWQAIAGVALGMSGASNAFSQIINNYLADSVRSVIAHDPLLVPNPETLVSLGVHNSMSWDNVYYLCAGQGYSAATVDALRAAAQSWPDITLTLELLRRNLIMTEDAQTYFAYQGIPEPIQNILLKLVTIPLSPADLADMVVRGIKPQDEARRVAAESGIAPADFDSLVLDTGEPPGLMQLLEAYRRHIIDRATLEHGIRQSRYRNEWIPTLEALRYTPMSVADAVNAVVQNHMSHDQGAGVADQNGLEPGSFDVLIETAGEPLSRTEMEELYNRGLVTEEQVKQALLESRVKDKYVDLAFQLHSRVLPVYSVQRALRYGGITHAEAVTAIKEAGYSDASAQILVNSGSMEKLQPFRNRVVSAVETAYEENTIPRDDAVTMIQKMGYESSEADFILQAADFRKSARIVTTVSNAIRSRYVSHGITRQQASNDLDQLGVPAAQRDYMLSLWDIEYAAHVRHLTEAQVVKAHKLQLIDDQDATDRLTAMGYSAVDADLLLRGA